ncbi:FAD-binding domain-containing protein [Dendrothele bispora CBS 962.96]|uniref:FAD-binding domain-containing protein n=1 Tax=Dendrothele bispora (strain CBS 962.96) TaxID=1314807 RepID=A0A4S8MK58_DENBC|nr:FAD-binding domain-containing protein [Dendrothele bispora CBS 962.96]
MVRKLQSVATLLSLLVSSWTCNAFRNQFQAAQLDVTIPNAYFSADESNITPSCRINPTSAEEVAQVLTTTTQLGCQFAVRSGGHMPWAGAANIEQPGVVIDLGFLNSTTLSADKSLAHVQPGSRWGPVYDTLAPEDLVVLGGRSRSVGVGGFLLGGGISFYSPADGFASNNVMGYQIVLANGTIVEANSEENPDLFWAMRLGSTNFGIVTRYDLKTIPSTKLWGGIRSYNRSHALEAAQALLDFDQKSGQLGLDSAGLDIGSSDEFFINVDHIGANIDDTDVFDSLLDIPFTSDTTREDVTLNNILEEIDALFPSGRHLSFRTIAFKPDAQFMVDFWQQGLKIFEPLQGNPDLTWTFAFTPVPVSLLKAAEQADDPYGISADDGSVMLTNLNAFWGDSLDENDVQSKLAELIEWGNTESQARGLANKWIYLNYASPDMKPYESIPEANLQRLKDVRQSVDPDSVLQSLWPGGFKI